MALFDVPLKSFFDPVSDASCSHQRQYDTHQFLNQSDISNLAQQYIISAPTTQYQKFLGDLSAKIGSVLQEWSEDAPENLIIGIQDYYKYWQQAIAKQTRDLQRMRS